MSRAIGSQGTVLAGIALIAAVAIGALVATSSIPFVALAAVLLIGFAGLGALASAGITPRLPGVPRDIDGPLSLSLTLLCIGVVTSSWNGVRAGPGLALCDVFFVLSALVFGVHLLTGGAARFVFPWWVVVPAYLLLVDVLLSTLASGSGLAPLVPGVRLVGAMLLTPILIGGIAGNLRAVWLIVDCWLISASVNATVASVDYLTGSDLGEGITGVLTAVRQAGLTTQPNHLGFVCVFALPFFFARFLGSSGVVRRILCLGGIGVCLLALLASGSRGGLVVGVFVLATAPFFQSANWNKVLRLLAVIVTGVAIAAVLLPSSLSFVSIERLTGGSSSAVAGVEQSNAVRSVRRDEALESFDSSPFYGTNFSTIKEAQNIYLQLLQAGGILALAAWLCFAAGGLVTSLRESRNQASDTSTRGLSGAVAGTFAAWMLLGAVENQLYDRYLFVPSGILVGILVYRLAQSSRVAASAHPRVRRYRASIRAA